MSGKITQKHAWTLSWETFVGWVCVAGYLAVVLLGVWIPDDFQTRWSGAKPFAEFMAIWNPQIAFVGDMPIAGAKENQFLYAVSWCVMPIFWGVFINRIYRESTLGSSVLTFKSPGELVALLVGLSLLLLLMFHPVGDVNGRLGQLFFGFKLTRSLFAPWAVFSVGFLFFLILRLVVAWLGGRIRFENEGKKK